MKVSEERLAIALAILKTVEVCVQRVGKIPRVAGRVDRVGRTIQVRSLFPNEVLPRRFVSHGTRAGQRQILEVQGAETALEIAGARSLAAEGPVSACSQRIGEHVLRQLPRSPAFAREYRRAIREVLIGGAGMPQQEAYSHAGRTCHRPRSSQAVRQ